MSYAIPIRAQRKYYYEGLGLRNARLNFRQQEETHLTENALYNELACRGYGVDVGAVELVERGDDGSRHRKQVEIDFVCDMASRRCYIQPSFAIPDSEKMGQEQRPLVNTGGSFKKVIVVRNRVSPTTTRAWSLWG